MNDHQSTELGTDLIRAPSFLRDFAVPILAPVVRGAVYVAALAAIAWIAWGAL